MLNILVCVKQVPESEAVVAIDKDARWVTIHGTSAFRMNHFDECAVESGCPDQGTISRDGHFMFCPLVRSDQRRSFDGP